MAISILVNGTTTLDETAGLQNAASIPPGDANDTDVDVSTLPAFFSNRLFGAGELALSSSFATSVGVSESPAALVAITHSNPLTTLGLTDSAGATLNGLASGITTTSGKAIYLYGDSANRIVLGKYDANGLSGDGNEAVAFAVYMDRSDPNATTTNLKLWTVTFTALQHPTFPASYDEAVDIFQNVYVTANSVVEFNFDTLPSGQNLFGAVGASPTSSGLLVFGRDPVLNADGTFTNASNTINTSKGGGPTTIGVNNQMFDPTEGAYFTYVNNIDERYLSGWTGGLDQNEADDADNMLYGSTNEADTAFFKISQTQGNSPATATIAAFNLSDTPKGQDLIAARGTGAVSIDKVTVYNAAGVKVEEATFNGTTTTNTLDGGSVQISFTNTAGVWTAKATNLASGYKVEWHTVSGHDQVLIGDPTGGGKWDVGAFGIGAAQGTSVSLANHVFVEDDGPAIGPIADGYVAFTPGDVAHPDGGSSGPIPLLGAPGTDGLGAYKITSFTNPVSVNGIALTAVLSNSDTVLNYFDDDNSNGVLDTGEQVIYKLELVPTSGAAKTDYVFTVVSAPVLEFGFDSLPSGQNLFGTVAADATSPGIAVFGKTPLLKADGTFTNASDTINTSKGGGPTTIGVNNQMFDPGEGAYFTYVNNIDARYLSGVPGGLDQNEADDADFLLYGSLNETSTAFFKISQIQGNSASSATITAFDLNSAYQGQDLISHRGGANSGGTQVDVTAVRVYNAAGTLLEDTGGGADSASIDVDIVGGVATVSGLLAGYKVEWDTAAAHDQVLIQDPSGNGKFDIGGFGYAAVTPDSKLDFTVTLREGDLDTASDSFSVFIDGNRDGSWVI